MYHMVKGNIIIFSHLFCYSTDTFFSAITLVQASRLVAYVTFQNHYVTQVGKFFVLLITNIFIVAVLVISLPLVKSLKEWVNNFHCPMYIGIYVSQRYCHPSYGVKEYLQEINSHKGREKNLQA